MPRSATRTRECSGLISNQGSTRTIGSGQARSQFAFHAESGRAAVSGVNGVQIIALDTGEVQCELPDDETAVMSLAWHPSGRYPGDLAQGEAITLWDLKTRPGIDFRTRGAARVVEFQQRWCDARLANLMGSKDAVMGRGHWTAFF